MCATQLKTRSMCHQRSVGAGPRDPTKRRRTERPSMAHAKARAKTSPSGPRVHIPKGAIGPRKPGRSNCTSGLCRDKAKSMGGHSTSGLEQWLGKEESGRGNESPAGSCPAARPGPAGFLQPKRTLTRLARTVITADARSAMRLGPGPGHSRPRPGPERSAAPPERLAGAF